MSFYSDHNGVYLQGMDDANDLRKFMQERYPEEEIQLAYLSLLNQTKALAKAEKITPLRAFWKMLERVYLERLLHLLVIKGVLTVVILEL
jgi:hypothetical protein